MNVEIGRLLFMAVVCLQAIEKIYRQHGWPDLENFRAKECREALDCLPDADDYVDEEIGRDESDDSSE